MPDYDFYSNRDSIQASYRDPFLCDRVRSSYDRNEKSYADRVSYRPRSEEFYTHRKSYQHETFYKSSAPVSPVAPPVPEHQISYQSTPLVASVASVPSVAPVASVANQVKVSAHIARFFFLWKERRTKGQRLFRCFQYQFCFKGQLIEGRKFTYCTEEEFKLATNRELRELRDFLRSRGVWVQKDKSISIAKALVNALSCLKEWPETEPFDAPSSDASAPPSPTQQSPEHLLGRAHSRVLDWVLDQPLLDQHLEQSSDRPQQPHPTAESTGQSNGPMQTSPEEENGPAVTLYEKENGPAVTPYEKENGPAVTPYKKENGRAVTAYKLAVVDASDPFAPVAPVAPVASVAPVAPVAPQQEEDGQAVIAHKLADSVASLACVASVAPVAPDAFVRLHQPTEIPPSGDASYRKENRLGIISSNDIAIAGVIPPHMANDVASATGISPPPSSNDVASATIISPPACDRPACDQPADRLSPTDTPPPSPYKSPSYASDRPSSPYESEQASCVFSFASSFLYKPPHQTLNGREEISSFLLFFKWPEKNKIISTFDEFRRLHRPHHHAYLRRPPNGRTSPQTTSTASSIID